MVNRRGFTPKMQKEIDALPHKLEIELGQYDPLLGYSYGELAGISRSFNESQSDGNIPRVRGEDKTILVTLEGTPATKDLFDDLTTWARLPGGRETGKLLEYAAETWNPQRPYEIIPVLAQAKELAAKIDDPEHGTSCRK